jgi:photosystem II stability/assembly factor-like uncharacterized protein
MIRLHIAVDYIINISFQRKLEMKTIISIMIIAISGQFSFANDLSLSSDYYIIYENQPLLEISVIRQSSNPTESSVAYQITSTTATPYSDYTPVNDLLFFGNGENRKTISIPIIDNQGAELFETALVKLSNPSGDASLITPYQATILFMDDEQIFQWQAPSFPYDTINDLWQSPDGSLWAVYNNGLVFRFNQYEKFESKQIPTHVSQNLNAIWGTHDANIYVTGDNGIILHYDGNTFSRVSTPTDRNLLAIWGTDTGFIVAGGVGNTLIQRTNTEPQWKRIKQGQLYDPDIYTIWGTDDHNFFAAGGKMALSDDTDGIIYYYFGPRWEKSLEKSHICFTDIWGINASQVQVCGFNENNRGIIAHYNGYDWTVQETSADPFTHIWGFDSKFIMGISKPTMSSVSTVGHLINNSWQPDTDSPEASINAISGDSIFNISIADSTGQIYKFDSQNWKQYNSDTRNNLKAVWGINDRQLYAVGENGSIYHTEGFVWTKETGIPSDISFNDIFGISATQIFAVGNNGIIYAYNGLSWESQSTPITSNLYGVWGDALDNAFAVGQSGTILHYNGTEWLQMPRPATNDLYDIASTASDAYAVGNEGIILRYNGAGWGLIRKPTDDQKDLMAIWGDSNSDTAYAVGRFGVVLQLSGTWHTIRAFDYHHPHLNSIMAFTDNYIIACGPNGHMILNDGRNWIPLPVPTSQELNALWGSDSSMTIVGNNGTIIRYASALQLSGATEVSEGDISEVNVQIFPEAHSHLPIDINIKAYPEDDVIVPSHIKLAAGRNSENLSIQFNHDGISDGPHWVNIFANVAEHQQAIYHILVMDTDDRMFTLHVPSMVNEADQLTECHLSLNSPADENITFRLFSDKSEQLSVPDSVIISKGYTSALFYVAPRDDLWIDGTQSVQITAMVPGWALSLSKTILVADNEIQTIVITGPDSVREEVSNPLFEAWIRLSAIPDTEFQISLSVSDATALSIPNSVTAHAGQQVIPLTLQVLDDQLLDGNQRVCLSATAPEWVSTDYTITVEDNEPGKIQFAFETYHVSENESYASIDLYRFDSESGMITVVCQTQPVSAEKDIDYQSVFTSIVFNTNEKKKYITIPIIEDSLVEDVEHLDIILSPFPDSASWVGDKSKAQLFIHDDDWQVEWHSPLPQGNTLNAVAAVSDQLMIAVGNNGTIIHWNGSESHIQNRLTAENLNGIFVVSSSEIYVVGENETFLYYNGLNWQRAFQFSPLGINSIWGPDSDHLFAAGEQASVFIRENGVWHPILKGDENDPTFYDIWGASKERVFIVGGYFSQGVIYEWDGATVSSMSIPDCKTLQCVWGTDENNVYAAGDGRVILHFDGSQWQVIQEYFDDSSLHAIWGPDDNNIFAVGGDLNGGLLLKKNNDIWEKQDQEIYHWVNDIDGFDDTIMIVGEYGSVATVQIPETQWHTIVQSQGDLKAIWGRHANDIFAVGDNQFKHYTNGEWHAITLTEGKLLNSVYGDDTTVFAVGNNGTVLSYENETLSYDTIIDETLKDIWGFQGHFYAVGENAIILCYTGTTWQKVSHELQSESMTFHSIWGTSLNNIFVVGENNRILQYNGSHWHLFSAPNINEGQTIHAIWGNADNTFYIAYENGDIYHYDQDQWFEFNNLEAAQYDLFAWENLIVSVGDNGIHVYEDIWTHLETGTDNALYGVWATENKIFAVGCASTQLLLEGQMPKTYTLTVQVLPINTGNVYVNGQACDSLCNFVFNEYDLVTIEAIPLTDYRFTGWAKDLTGTQSNDSIQMTENKAIAAQFNEIQQSEPPVCVYPIDGEIIDGTSVTLIADINNDQALDYRTYWRIRILDQPYTCCVLNESLCIPDQSRFCYQSDSQPFTSYVLTDLAVGFKYAWQFGYLENYQSRMNWSVEKVFICGRLEEGRTITINKGASTKDYRAISFVQWFPDSHVEAVIGHSLKNGYDTRFIRFGTYDPSTGGYIEYGDKELLILPGKSYWVLTDIDIPMPVNGVPVKMEKPVEIKLTFGRDGWNMIAAPNHASYTWRDIQIVAYDDNNEIIDLSAIMPVVQKDRYVIGNIIDSNLIDIENALISPFLWKWVEGNYKQTAYLDPYEGYWVKVKRSNVSLRFNPDAQLPSGLKRTKVSQRQDLDLPPLPMSGFDDGMSGIGSGCLIDNVLP